ncbi:putative receptor-like protein kinase At4g00960 [Coffea eugenioides]|uniref:putative receptor-like protein kinase At4g00960 n=1 Tax=Coffea eugenioides TaxID=49369 RepID=UPI000F612641|nr:putative receptor-like protein kinase At4g00960 [Coffea eugenioides]
MDLSEVFLCDLFPGIVHFILPSQVSSMPECKNVPLSTFDLPDSDQDDLQNSTGSTYTENLNFLLSTLSSNTSLTSRNGFYNFTASHDPSNMVYGLFLCRGDVNPDVCGQCVANARGEILKTFLNRKTAFISHDECLYALYKFYSSVSPTPKPSSNLGPTPLPFPPPSNSTNSEEGGRISTKTIVAIVVLVSIAILLFIVGFYIARRSRKKYDVIIATIGTSEISIIESLQYNLIDIQATTNNFAIGNKIGEGGFGPIYKGTLHNGQEIAVKRLSRSSAQDTKEFKNEITLVARLKHRNLVRLLGFCLEREERILIYEFITNKSPDYYLFDLEKQPLSNWSKRYKVIGGIAKGLLYLHEDSRLRIIHCDLKASNVLLDRNMDPKIANFGLARLFEVDQTEGNTSKIEGTFGYMAPEYALHGLFSVKSDVFSFGVLALEILSGKKNSQFYQAHREDDLLSYAWRQWRDGTTLALIDVYLDREGGAVTQSIHIGLLCVQDKIEQRPIMASVVLMLNSYSVTLPAPNPPAYFGQSRIQSLPNNLPEFDTSSGTKFLPSSSMNEVSITELYPR